MNRPTLALAGLLAALLAETPGAQAHEFIVKPGATQAAAGAPVPFSILSAHVFMTGEELEGIEDVSVAILADGKRQPLPFTVGQAAFTYAGQATAPSAGTFMLVGSRLPQIWSATPEGMKRGAPAQLPGALRPTKYEKFAKTLVNLSPNDPGFAARSGDRLEIVPITNPGAFAAGQDLRVQVLFDGQPLSTRVYATYDGFTDNPNTYAYVTETADDGTARVRLTKPGLWMVRVEQRAAVRAADHEQYVGRAVLVFEAKE